MAKMRGWEIVLRTFTEEPSNALRIFVKDDKGGSKFIDLTHEAVMQLEEDLRRIIDRWEKEPD